MLAVIEYFLPAVAVGSSLGHFTSAYSTFALLTRDQLCHAKEPLFISFLSIGKLLLLILAEKLHDISTDNIGLKIEQGANLQLSQIGMFARVRDQRDREAVRQALDNGEAYAVDSDKALCNHEGAESFRQLDFDIQANAVFLQTENGGGCFNVSLHHVAADATIGCQRPLQIDFVARL